MVPVSMILLSTIAHGGGVTPTFAWPEGRAIVQLDSEAPDGTTRHGPLAELQVDRLDTGWQITWTPLVDTSVLGLPSAHDLEPVRYTVDPEGHFGLVDPEGVAANLAVVRADPQWALLAPPVQDAFSYAGVQREQRALWQQLVGTWIDRILLEGSPHTEVAIHTRQSFAPQERVVWLDGTQPCGDERTCVVLVEEVRDRDEVKASTTVVVEPDTLRPWAAELYRHGVRQELRFEWE